MGREMQGRGEEEENKEVSLAPKSQTLSHFLHPKVTATQHFTWTSLSRARGPPPFTAGQSQDQMSFESWVSHN